MNWRATLAVPALLALLGAAEEQTDSQVVLKRYAVAVATLAQPKVVAFSYMVSQVGPSNIEQRHRIYRSGLDVRDETLVVDGITLRRKVVRFLRHEDRYAVARFAPSAASDEMLFLGTVKDGHHLDYVYEVSPLDKSAATAIDRVTIDGISFLPRSVHFRSSGLGVTGTGEITFAPFGKYWMPILAEASAHLANKPAHEQIAWSDYRFPDRLPPSTFQAPHALPHSTLPNI